MEIEGGGEIDYEPADAQVNRSTRNSERFRQLGRLRNIPAVNGFASTWTIYPFRLGILFFFLHTFVSQNL